MKIRTDFVTNSSSSSFVSVTIVDGIETAEESFRFYDSSAFIGHSNQWGILSRSVYEALPLPTSGFDILVNLEKFFRGMPTGETVKCSEKIKDIGNILNGAVRIHQIKSFDSGEKDYCSLNYCIKDGDPIPCDSGQVWDLVNIAGLNQSPIESAVVFTDVKNPEKVNQIIEKLEVGTLLGINYSDQLLFRRTIIGKLKEKAPYIHGMVCAEIAEVVPLSKRRKGSKYPLMKVMIKPKYTVEEYISLAFRTDGE